MITSAAELNNPLPPRSALLMRQNSIMNNQYTAEQIATHVAGIGQRHRHASSESISHGLAVFQRSIEHGFLSDALLAADTAIKSKERDRQGFRTTLRRATAIGRATVFPVFFSAPAQNRASA